MLYEWADLEKQDFRKNEIKRIEFVTPTKVPPYLVLKDNDFLL